MSLKVVQDVVEIGAKLGRLRLLLGDLAPVLVAFSGGVDSTVLVKACLEAIGTQGVLAVTVRSEMQKAEEAEEATRVAAWLGAPHLLVDMDLLAVPGLAANPPERCFLCREAMFQRLLEVAREKGLKTVIDGTNGDDLGTYRPGIRAAVSLGVRSPLAEVGLLKEEVRAAARQWGIPNWDLPSSPCLASRFPYGESITREKLKMVAAGERFLQGLGLHVVRVRHHEVGLARIECRLTEAPRLFDGATRQAVVDHFRGLGYDHVTLDLEGYRSGSFDEALGSGNEV